VFDVILTIVILSTTLLAYRVLGSAIVQAVRSGRWTMNGANFGRTDRPIMYYSAVLAFSLMVLMMAGASYAVITIWMNG
jgi:hypothetical protein